MKRLICTRSALPFVFLAACDDGSPVDGNEPPVETGVLAQCNATATADLGLPILHTINEKTFAFPYSCEPDDAEVHGYEGAALFLSAYSQEHNGPELLYNGACGSEAYFESATAGDEFALLADLGDVPLESLTATQAFNYDNVVGHDNTFTASVPVVENHTYVGLKAAGDVRTLFVFRVDAYTPDGEATIRYAVKQYGVNRCVEESEGFSWGLGNE